MTQKTIDIIISTMNQEIRILKENIDVDTLIDEVKSYIEHGHIKEAIKAIEDYKVESKHIRDIELAKREFEHCIDSYVDDGIFTVAHIERLI